MKLLLSLSICLAVLAAPAAAQSLYKWTDAQGRVQYADQPPAGQKAERISRSGAAASAPSTTSAPAAAATTGTKAAAAPMSAADQELAFRKRRMEQQEKEEKLAQEDAAAKQREADCNRAKSSLAGLEQGERMVYRDDKGEYQHFSDAQRQSEIQRRREQISKGCN